ncbi:MULTISPECIES: L,D-transpeptidase family protein [unclassified Devosia]|uniref:L,D-transpeptidase family protein n=1 Tax=unclassified Devosia TaxID=196773 RepID=UPI00145DCA2C|nr:MULTISPECIES: L,D-transpeptidase family protein [unclassified Devosia]MBJ6986827.1 L,D-transpeptidase family protein [Devosia sp. MC521]QMW63860.1 L,D-transpeptidase family protein [Devosia sp. MC521]
MLLNRRKFLGGCAYLGATLTLPSAHAQGWFGGNRVVKVDQAGNTAAAEALIATREPILSFDTLYNLQLAISQYEPFVAAGGWEEIPQQAFRLALGASSPAVVAVKRRLISSGDMPLVEYADDSFDADTDRGVRAFQARHGLVVNGQIDEATWYAMNVSAAQRMQQLYLNYTRVQNMAAKLNARYVVVNIPAATIEAVNEGAVEQRHTAVVGRADRATPIMASNIHQVNFNPYWHVPKSLIRQDLTKYMMENSNYLAEQNIFIYDGSTKIDPQTINWANISDREVNYMYRQEPGAANSMGHCKINFYNPYDCYLHDTPGKELFGENARFHSSGCVRVNDVNQMVNWLLRDNGDWDQNKVDSTFEALTRLDVEVKARVPIHTTYITAWANRQGTVSFRDDVYKFDEQGKVSFQA